MSTVRKYIRYINSHRTDFNLSELAEIIEMDKGNFSRALRGRNMANGKPQVIPERCLPKLSQYFKEKRIKI